MFVATGLNFVIISERSDDASLLDILFYGARNSPPRSPVGRGLKEEIAQESAINGCHSSYINQRKHKTFQFISAHHAYTPC
jgi:hypothetical protein